MLVVPQQEIRQARWPSPQDYNEAVQNVENIADPVMASGRILLDSAGLPRPVSGGFATVYRIDCKKSSFALRCFLTENPDQALRYKLISDFIKSQTISPLVPFEFIEAGLRANGRWVPVLKMNWVDGKPLDQYIADYLHKPSKLEELSKQFLDVVSRIQTDNVAHGDLQHGNILVLPSGDLKLVDYD